MWNWICENNINLWLIMMGMLFGGFGFGLVVMYWRDFIKVGREYLPIIFSGVKWRFRAWRQRRAQRVLAKIDRLNERDIEREWNDVEQSY